MTCKYRVKLIHDNGYGGIHGSIGKEFNAAQIQGFYWIHTNDLESNCVPPNTYLVFDKEAVEVLEIETTHKLSEKS